MVDSFEKIPCQIFGNSIEGSVHVAQEIARLIKEKQAGGEKCVLGLSTGFFDYPCQIILQNLLQNL